MNAIIYHSRDLDGLSSGAVLLEASRSQEKLNHWGYHYGEDFDIRKLSRRDACMVDVSFPIKKMFSAAKISRSFIWIDHHVSAFEDFMDYCTENKIDFKTTKMGLITMYFNKELDFTYYYAPRLSACEICSKLYVEKTNKKDALHLLGQYDTWRNNIKKKFVNDKDWDKEVIPFQYGMRMYGKRVEDVRGVLDAIADWRSDISVESIINQGKTILKYQKGINADNMKHSFDIQIGELKGVAFNGGPFNSKTFEGKYYPEVYDFMMPFAFLGGKWNVSLYTTKDDVDILSIAKGFGGGGHKQACGFQLPAEQLRFDVDGRIFIGPELKDDFNFKENLGDGGKE